VDNTDGPECNQVGRLCIHLNILTHLLSEMVIARLNVLMSLALASVLAVLHVPFPSFCGDIIYYLVKRSERLIINGESDCKQFCPCVQTDGEDACSVVEENEPDDGLGGPREADESGGVDQREPIGGKAE